VVCLKPALDPAMVRYSASQRRLVVETVRYVLGPADRAALELALRMRGQVHIRGQDGRVVLLSVAPPEAEGTLREALGAGADEAVLCLSPYSPPGLDIDSSAIAQVLAAAIERLGGVALVLCGARSLGGGRGQIGPRVAEALGWACVTYAAAMTIKDGPTATNNSPINNSQSSREPAPQGSGGFGRRLLVERYDGDVVERLELDLPAVVTIAPGAAELRVISPLLLLRAMRRGHLDRWNLEDLGIEGGKLPQGLTVRRMESTRGRRTPQVFTPSSPEEAAEMILGQLLERRLV